MHSSSLAGNSDIKETLYPSELVPGAKEEKNSVSPAWRSKKRRPLVGPSSRPPLLDQIQRDQVKERDRACDMFKREKTGPVASTREGRPRLWQVQEREDRA